MRMTAHTHMYRIHNSYLYLIQWEHKIIPQQQNQNQPAISLQAKPPCYVRRGAGCCCALAGLPRPLGVGLRSGSPGVRAFWWRTPLLSVRPQSHTVQGRAPVTSGPASRQGLPKRYVSAQMWNRGISGSPSLCHLNWVICAWLQHSEVSPRFWPFMRSRAMTFVSFSLRSQQICGSMSWPMPEMLQPFHGVSCCQLLSRWLRSLLIW